MHYCQVDRMGADCINSAQSKCLPKPLALAQPVYLL
jgi:hypothetical protein